MDDYAIECVISQVTGELGPFADQELIVASFEKRDDQRMSFKGFVEMFFDASCGATRCAAAVDDADDADDDSGAGAGAASAPETVQMHVADGSDSAAATDGIIVAAQLNKDLDSAFAQYDGFGAAVTVGESAREPACYLDIAQLVDAAADVEAATAAISGASDDELAVVGDFMAPGMSLRCAMEAAPDELLTDLHHAARVSHDGDDEIDEGLEAAYFDLARLRACNAHERSTFTEAALGLSDELRRSTTRCDGPILFGDEIKFEKDLGHVWGAAVKKIVDGVGRPYAPQEVLESAATYTLEARQALVRDVVEKTGGAMDQPYEAILEMASAIVTQAAVTLLQRNDGGAYMTNVAGEMRSILAMTGDTSEPTAVTGIAAIIRNPLTTRSQLLKGLRTLVSQAGARTPVQAVRRAAALNTNGFLKIFASKWGLSKSGDKNFSRDTSGLYASAIIGALIMRDMVTLASVYDNLGTIWSTSAVPLVSMSIQMMTLTN